MWVIKSHSTDKYFPSCARTMHQWTSNLDEAQVFQTREEAAVALVNAKLNAAISGVYNVKKCCHCGATTQVTQ